MLDVADLPNEEGTTRAPEVHPHPDRMSYHHTTSGPTDILVCISEHDHLAIQLQTV
jgi:hypothetical protein